MKLFTLIISNLCFIIIFSQKNNISITYSPTIINFENINSKYNLLTHQNINVDFNKTYKPQFGINYIKKIKKYNFGVGLSYKNINYNYRLLIKKKPFNTISDSYFTIKRNINLSILGIRLITSYQIFKQTKISLLLEYNYIYKTIDPFFSNKKNTNFYWSKAVNGQITDRYAIQIEEKREGFKNFWLPEINLQTQIIKNLSIYYGVKLKMWNTDDVYSINVKGYYGINQSIKVLHHSIINNKHLAYYFGFSYNFIVTQVSHP